MRSMQGHRDEQACSCCRDTRQFGPGSIVVCHVLHDVERANQVERCIGKRQRGHHANQRVGAACAQLCDRRRADIEELRSFNRQAWPQARRDFQPPDSTIRKAAWEARACSASFFWFG